MQFLFGKNNRFIIQMYYDLRRKKLLKCNKLQEAKDIQDLLARENRKTLIIVLFEGYFRCAPVTVLRSYLAIRSIEKMEQYGTGSILLLLLYLLNSYDIIPYDIIILKEL